MVLQISVATAEDADTIATIHLAASNQNVLLHAQFPTKESLASLHECLKQDVLETLKAGNVERTNLVVRDSNTDQIISIAKWDLPNITKDADGSFLSIWPPNDARQDLLDEYTEKAGAAKMRVVGDARCYRLTFVGTHPEHMGRGAGTLLTKWGLSKGSQKDIPVYLESTVSVSSFYRRLGFVSQDGFSMSLSNMGIHGEPCIYEELCMIRKWDVEEGMDHWDSSLDVSNLTLDYEAGITPQLVVQAIYDRIEAYQQVQLSLWIHLQPIGDVMGAANELLRRWPDESNRPPLWGVPFSVKDSFNVAGIPTTIGCPALAFTPTSSAFVYQRCIDAGALFIGKTNMEQLATGMTGCRSPYGTLHSTFSTSHIVGGSSSGSAVSVSQGLVSFSLGSDTAGSIRVPAMFNGLVGFKPTKGTVSAHGVAPACLHQDCVSFLGLTTEDTETVWKICRGFDKNDYFAKPPPFQLSSQIPSECVKPTFKFGTPPDSALEICNPIYRKRFQHVVAALESSGGQQVDLDWTPFASANALLYNSTFVLERLTTLPKNWFDQNKESLHPVIRSVFENALARHSTPIDVFNDLHKQAEYKRIVEDILTLDDNDELTVMIVPTTPFHPTIEEVERDPVGINGRLGAFAHFANVLDLVAVAVPCGSYGYGWGGKRLPFGVTVLAGTGLDHRLLGMVKMLEDGLRDVGEDDD
ncbi:hypothetical protein SBOR_0697 [Sclerotinia borealis F-4128]|uniref:N-acetyltransferase domain-containing protein n=1 Tax=Sclerotinia borealis (strain F-4128) TaxID=1432307 RepID=W9CW48_SCLBF|nr:hypothetical protein SBOR_0697 [Sclerotinia borealis F-4128]